MPIWRDNFDESDIIRVMEKQNGQVLEAKPNSILHNKGGLTVMFVVLYLVSAGVLAYGAYQYGLFKGNQQSTSNKQQGVYYQPIESNSADATNDQQPTAIKQQPTINKQQSVTKSGVTPSPSPTPTNTNLINYKYQLPNGWQIVQAKDASFEVGFDPSQYKPDIENISEIRIVKLSDSSLVYDIKLQNFSGTDKKSFIFNTAGINPVGLNQGKEKKFSVDGRECLFIEGINTDNYGQFLGMCQAGVGKAFFVDSRIMDYLAIAKSIRGLR